MSNNENIVKIKDNFKLYEIDGEVYSLEELKGFIESSKELAQKCERQSRFIRALKLNNAKTTEERNNLIDELTTIKRMSMFEFSNTYGTAEQQEADGRAFARALLGGA